MHLGITTERARARVMMTMVELTQFYLSKLLWFSFHLIARKNLCVFRVRSPLSFTFNFYRQKLQKPKCRFISSVHCICLHFFFLSTFCLYNRSIRIELKVFLPLRLKLFYVFSACECQSNSIFIHSIFNSNSRARESVCVFVWFTLCIQTHTKILALFIFSVGHCCTVFAYYFLLLLFLLIIFSCLYTYNIYFVGYVTLCVNWNEQIYTTYLDICRFVAIISLYLFTVIVNSARCAFFILWWSLCFVDVVINIIG